MSCPALLGGWVGRGGAWPGWGLGPQGSSPQAFPKAGQGPRNHQRPSDEPPANKARTALWVVRVGAGGGGPCRRLTRPPPGLTLPSLPHLFPSSLTLGGRGGYDTPGGPPCGRGIALPLPHHPRGSRPATRLGATPVGEVAGAGGLGE